MVAATLLDLKAARLLPAAEVEDEEDLALLEARDLLFARLLQYKAYKEAAAHHRRAGGRGGRGASPARSSLEPRFAEALPDLVLGIGARAARRSSPIKAMTPKPVPKVVASTTCTWSGSASASTLLILRDRLRRGSAPPPSALLCADCESHPRGGGPVPGAAGALPGGAGRLRPGAGPRGADRTLDRRPPTAAPSCRSTSTPAATRRPRRRPLEPGLTSPEDAEPIEPRYGRGRDEGGSADVSSDETRRLPGRPGRRLGAALGPPARRAPDRRVRDREPGRPSPMAAPAVADERASPRLSAGRGARDRADRTASAPAAAPDEPVPAVVAESASEPADEPWPGTGGGCRGGRSRPRRRPEPALADDAELRGALEAILLVVDKPVSEMRAGPGAGAADERIGPTLDALAAGYTAAGHGFDLRRVAGGWRFYTRAEYAVLRGAFRPGRAADPADPGRAGDAGRGRLQAAGDPVAGLGDPGCQLRRGASDAGHPRPGRGVRHRTGQRGVPLPDHHAVPGEARA